MSLFSRQGLGKFGTVLLLVVGAISLFFAQSAYWINHTVFDKESFSTITTDALTSQSSRDAIASSVVNKALEDRPVAKKVIGERVISLTSGLLGSDFSNQAISALSSKTYAYATASNRQDIAIDLTAVKDPLNGIIALAESQGASVPEPKREIPDEIVLIESDNFPDLSGAVKAMLWLGPVFWLTTLITFSIFIYLGRKNYAKRVYLVGLSIIIISLLGIFTSPFIPPPIAAAVPNIDLRPVAQNIAQGFLAPFTTQMYVMLGTTLIALLVFNQRFTLLKLSKTFETKVSSIKQKNTK